MRHSAHCVSSKERVVSQLACLDIICFITIEENFHVHLNFTRIRSTSDYRENINFHRDRSK